MVCMHSTRSPDVMRSGSSVIIRYLDEHVRQGYTFLMQNYIPGDKICIFGTCAEKVGKTSGISPYPYPYVGFSRGAYTARALAGMLHKVHPRSSGPIVRFMKAKLRCARIRSDCSPGITQNRLRSRISYTRARMPIMPRWLLASSKLSAGTFRSILLASGKRSWPLCA